MKKKSLFVFLMSIVVFGFAAQVHATPISVNFDFRSGPDQLYDKLSITQQGVTLDVTAFMMNESDDWISVTGSTAGVHHGSDGLGVQLGLGNDSNKLDSASNNTGTDRDEGLLFSFDTNVKLTYIDFASFGVGDSFNLDVDGNNELTDFRSTTSSGRTIGDYQFAGYEGSQFFIWADDSTDAFSIEQIAIEFDVVPVPLPSTVLMMIAGLIALRHNMKK